MDLFSSRFSKQLVNSYWKMPWIKRLDASLMSFYPIGPDFLTFRRGRWSGRERCPAEFSHRRDHQHQQKHDQRPHADVPPIQMAFFHRGAFGLDERRLHGGQEDGDQYRDEERRSVRARQAGFHPGRSRPKLRRLHPSWTPSRNLDRVAFW